MKQTKAQFNQKNKQRTTELNREIITTLIPFFITIIMEFFFGICRGGIYSAINMQLMSILFSVLIICLMYGILIPITKKFSTSTIIISIMATIFLIINDLKIGYTGDTILISDINFATSVGGLLQMISGDIPVLLKFYLPRVIPLIVIFVLLIIWTKKNEIILKNLKARIILPIISIVIFIILVIPSKHTKNIFLNLFLNSEAGSYTTTLGYCDDYSLLAGIYGILLNDRFYEPEGYNEEELNAILDDSSKIETADTYGKPNIILVFSESFWDIDKQSDVEFNEEVAPNIKKLKQEGKLVETLSCAYGRLSENIVFELLTGGSLNYFNKGYIPIMSLYKRNNSEEIPSILKDLKLNNYRTKIVFGEDYYKSEKAMKKLGFDEYTDVETAESIENPNNISDEYLTNLIIQELENKKDDEKIFYMTETIQNHMPYLLEKYESYDISIKNSNLKEEDNEAILSYAQGVHDADKQLNRLYEYIKQYDEPTILVFLGDHLPYLYTKNIDNNAINKINYFNTGNELEDVYRKYNTQALILSNYNLDTSGIPNYLSNNMLLTYIVNNMDIEISSYYKWLYTTMEHLPATNSYISLDINRNKYNTEELTGDMERINELREHMQYKLFIKPTQ